MTFLHEHLVQRFKYVPSMGHASGVPPLGAKLDTLRNPYKTTRLALFRTQGSG
jgi:hypothetical protein